MTARPIRNILGTALGLLFSLTAAQAVECTGRNLLDALPAESRAEIAAAVDRVPYHNGILWRAARGDARITLVGTYHFGDLRHQTTLARIAPDLDNAATLLVEAGPEDEARLTQALTDDPSLMVNQSGPTLAERLSPNDWAALAAAMTERGTPSVLTAKLQPWYVSMMLGISPCMFRAMAADENTGGLDKMLMARAEDRDIPIRSLESWDTVFKLFANLSVEEENDMIRASLPAAGYADDYAVTLSDAYFAGDVWSIWEFGRIDAYANSGMSVDQVDAQIDLAQTKLMDQRNAAWIAPLTQAAEAAADQGKGVVAGFGALHLPGENGVLRLLEKDGWTITPLGEAG